MSDSAVARALAELRERRAAIDRAIAALEGVSRPSGRRTLAAERTQAGSRTAVVAQFVRAANGPVRLQQMSQHVLDKRLSPNIKAATAACATIAGRLCERGDIVKLGRGLYAAGCAEPT